MKYKIYMAPATMPNSVLQWLEMPISLRRRNKLFAPWLWHATPFVFQPFYLEASPNSSRIYIEVFCDPSLCPNFAVYSRLRSHHLCCAILAAAVIGIELVVVFPLETEFFVWRLVGSGTQPHGRSRQNDSHSAKIVSNLPPKYASAIVMALQFSMAWSPCRLMLIDIFQAHTWLCSFCSWSAPQIRTMPQRIEGILLSVIRVTVCFMSAKVMYNKGQSHNWDHRLRQSLRDFQYLLMLNSEKSWTLYEYEVHC